MEIEIKLGENFLSGKLDVPAGSKSITLFIHGSGSDRFSRRNNYLVERFNRHGFATLVVDLLTKSEKEDDHHSHRFRFDIDLLTERVDIVTSWLIQNPITCHLSIQYFSSSTGSAAAFRASLNTSRVCSLISRGGRFGSLDSQVLESIKIPILLIVGSLDKPIIRENIDVYRKAVRCNIKKMVTIRGATHYFEEKGKLEEVGQISILWSRIHLLSTGEKFNIGSKFSLGFQDISHLLSVFRMRFKDRASAGHMLGKFLYSYKNTNVIVVGIPRGGIIVADIVANKLNSQNIGIFIVKRLKDMYNPEITIGAIGQSDEVFLNERSNILPISYIKSEILRQRSRLQTELSEFGAIRLTEEFTNSIVILIDDGAFTGSTLIVATKWILSQNPKKLIIAVPVLPKETLEFLHKYVDHIYYIRAVKNFTAVEDYYINYPQLTNKDIVETLKKRIQ